MRRKGGQEDRMKGGGEEEDGRRQGRTGEGEQGKKVTERK